IDYVCNAKNTNVELDGRELQEYVWVTPRDAMHFDLENFTRNFVEHFILYQNGKYVPNCVTL
ncbi:MAG: hypothetical protein ACLPY5_01275, partial [Candidatus Bathyarchaeia archaeon]